MNPYKFSIIFMRDDSNVRRMRVSPLVLKIIVCLEISLILCAGVAGYFGVHFWLVNKKLNDTLSDFKHSAQQTTIELERLHNMEQLIQNDDKENRSSLMASAQAQKNKTFQAPVIDLQKILKKIDERIFTVTNVQIRLKKHKAHLSFDLNKTDTNNNLVKGEVNIQIITASGNVVSLKTQKKLGFEVRRMKQFRQYIILPNSLSINRLFAIRISIIDSTGKMVFSESYPIYNILV